jgi:hypothetical protein
MAAIIRINAAIIADRRIHFALLIFESISLSMPSGCAKAVPNRFRLFSYS